MIGFVAFSIRRAWQGFWRNFVMSLAATATMVLMLMLLAGFWVIQTGLSASLEFVEQKVEIVADVNPSASINQINALADQVRAMDEVLAVTYVNPDTALKRFRALLQAQGRPDLTVYLERNPLRGSIEVKLKNARVFGNVVDVLRADTTVVTSVKEIQKLVESVLTVTNVLRTGGLILLALVGITVLFIIVNTIRLAVVARAEEIEIMRLVGASDAFIRWPFIFEGAMVGLLGAAVTLGLLTVAGGSVSDFLFDLFRVLPLQFGALATQLVVLVFGAG
ncbi:MAG: permease-like cell division protein FtsX, partial [Candidatus Limnocylindrales bacterium]